MLDRLEALGFVRSGRLFSLPAQDLVWEMPGDHLDPLDTAVEVSIPGGDRILMLRREDMIEPSEVRQTWDDAGEALHKTAA